MIKGILTACLLMLIQSPSPEPEKAWLRWINSAPWDRAEQQSQPEYQEQYTKNVATPPPDKDHEQTRSEGANKANEKSSDIWQKAFAPEQWPQWALLVVGLFG